MAENVIEDEDVVDAEVTNKVDEEEEEFQDDDVIEEEEEEELVDGAIGTRDLFANIHLLDLF